MTIDDLGAMRDGLDEFGRAILDSAKEDMPPRGTAERLALGVSSVLAVQTATKSLPAKVALTKVSSLSALAVYGVGSALVAAAIAAGVVTAFPAYVRTPTASPLPVGPTTMLPTLPSVTEPALAKPSPTGSAEPATVTAPPTPKLAAPKAGSRSTREAASSSRPLAEEVSLVARIRDAIARGDDGAARRMLTDYDARFPTGELAVEARTLEARLRSGSSKP